MVPMNDAAREFLAQQRIAIAGFSRNPKAATRFIYDKLKSTGHTVFAVNPKIGEVDTIPCYPDLGSIPGGVDGVVAVTSPEITEEIARQCVEEGVPRLWMHRSIGNSVSTKAISLCREHGVTVIPGGCPMMYQSPVDFGHRCIKWVLRATGSLPGEIE